MIYSFVCDNCSFEQEVSKSIKEGPPVGELSCPNCDIELRHVLGGNFILIGDWPGKKISAASAKAREETDKKLDEADVGKKEANEILKERRKGRKKWREYQKHNKPKVERYKSNMRKGIKSDLPKKKYEI